MDVILGRFLCKSAGNRIENRPFEDLARLDLSNGFILGLELGSELLQINTERCFRPMTAWSDTAVLQIQCPVGVVELKTPLVTTQRENQALNPLLPVQDHLIRSGLAKCRHRCALVISRSVNDLPERPMRDALVLLKAIRLHLPQQKRTERPATE